MKRTVCVIALALLSMGRADAQPLVPMADSGTTTFGDWSFSWEIGTAHFEGLVLRNVRWKGTKVLHKASLPVIRVKYRGDAADIEAGCGPYRDRIGGVSTNLQGQTSKVVARFFGDNLMEIAVFAEIGGYDLYQAFYFHRFGRFEPMLYSSGWSCHQNGAENDHKHHPYWRLDFDVDGIANRVRHVMTVSGGGTTTAAYTSESGFTVPATATGIVWTVANSSSGRSVRMRAPGNELADVDGPLWFGFGRRDAHVRRYRFTEDEGWTFPAIAQLGYFTPAEATDDQDVVFWSIAHLSHAWSQADVANPRWHSKGWIVDVTW